MNSHDFSKVVLARQAYCRELLTSKAAEYTGNNDRCENFKRAAGLTGQTPEQALLGMVAKHWVSLVKLIEDHKVGNQYREIWEEKITDAINYMHLLEAVLLDLYGEDAVENSFHGDMED